MRTLIIAEAGVNHNGDIEIGKRLIQEAAMAGADIVKFQSFKTHLGMVASAPKAEYQIVATGSAESQYEMVHRLELSEADHEILVSECTRSGIEFLSTAFDFESFDIIQRYYPKRVKVPSGEITNLPLLRYLAAAGKDILLSTGMAKIGEVEEAINVFETAGIPRSRITVMHCTTEYPAPMCDVNLKAMVSMGAALGVPVGYSDHTEGIEVSLAAVALGATVIEKHFTLSRTMSGPDHAASIEPAEMQALVKAIRNIEAAMGDGVKRPTASDLKNLPIARKSLVARRPIIAGELFTSENVTAKRPNSGISPMHIDIVLGRAAPRDFLQDELIEI